MANHAGFDGEEPVRSASPAPVRRRIAALVAAAGLVMALPVFQLLLEPSTNPDRALHACLPVACALGCYAAGWIGSSLLGQPGRTGWKRAFAGSAGLAVLGSSLSGGLALLAVGALEGPIVATALMLTGALGGTVLMFLGWVAFAEDGLNVYTEGVAFLVPFAVLFILTIPLHLLARRVRRHAE
ncbi:hypothetical protein [Tropicimonas sediminicola]|nr:hypothetical protein [Tropicimonas sediminicola]